VKGHQKSSVRSLLGARDKSWLWEASGLRLEKKCLEKLGLATGKEMVREAWALYTPLSAGPP
jgi:hypothetical protein